MWVRVEEERRQADRRFRVDVDRTIRSYRIEDLESDFGLDRFDWSVSSLGIAFLFVTIVRRKIADVVVV